MNLPVYWIHLAKTNAVNTANRVKLTPVMEKSIQIIYLHWKCYLRENTEVLATRNILLYFVFMTIHAYISPYFIIYYCVYCIQFILLV